MTNSEVQNLLECRKLFPPKFSAGKVSAGKVSAAPTARSCGWPGEKEGVLFVVPQAACGTGTSLSESRRGGSLSTLTYAFLSVGATAHKTWSILSTLIRLYRIRYLSYTVLTVFKKEVCEGFLR